MAGGPWPCTCVHGPKKAFPSHHELQLRRTPQCSARLDSMTLMVMSAYRYNSHFSLRHLSFKISSRRLHTVPNAIVSITRREKTTTTRHRDVNTPAAHVCRRRARGHDIRSGNDGTTNPRDCEHHDGLRNWSCGHEKPSVHNVRDWVCQIHTKTSHARADTTHRMAGQGE